MRQRLSMWVGLHVLLIFGVGGSPGFAQAETAPGTQQVEEVRFDLDHLRVEAVDAADGTAGVAKEVVVRYLGAASAPAGAPDLPRMVVWVEVPAGMRVVKVSGEPWGVEAVGVVRVRPAPTEARVGEAPPEVRADPAIYGGSGTYPGSWAVLGTEGSLRGHAVVGLWVSPVRWEVASGRLERAAGVRVVLELEPGDSGREVLARHRVVREIEERFEAGARKMVRGFEPAAAVGTAEGSTGTGPAGPGPFQPTFRPTTDGSAVQYVIVTSSALESEFQRLANWKTQKGVQGVVRTVEWIDQTYPNGVDRAERVRFFIRDAYQNWGTLFVLLGGDTDVVPPRYAYTLLEGGETIPCDYYYGCLDGNWNADGDDRFGESMTEPPGDEVDFLPEVHIGRVPASTVAEAAAIVDKTLRYEINAPASTRYPASILVLAELLFEAPPIHGADIAEEALAFVPPWFRRVRLYEESQDYPGSIELTRQVAIDSVNAGFGVVHHVGHGYRNTMSVGQGTLNNADADNLTNNPLNSVLFAINCSSASIDFNSIGERWVKNPNGGSIAYLGTSRLAFVSPSREFQNAWYSAVFADSIVNLGAASDMARLVLVPGSTFDTSFRWNLLVTTLLGDPETDIYLNRIVPLQVSHPSSVVLGGGPVTVTVNAQGTPVAGASVTLWKGGDAYVRATTLANGTAQLPVSAFQTTGPVTVTVHKTYYRSTTSTITINTTPNPFLFVLSSQVDDDAVGSSIGDGDGMADAGERIELRVTLKNGGGAQATGVNATLTANDPEAALTLLHSIVSYGTIGAGGSSQGTGAYVISISETAPVAYQPILTVTATGAQGSWADVLPLPLRRPYLEHYSHVVDDAAPRGNGNGIVEGGEQIWYRVRLRNAGQDRAAAVTGTLRALHTSNYQPHPLVTVTDASSTFATIPPGGQVEGDRFAFTLDLSADPATVILELTLNDALGQAGFEFLDVISPLSTDSLTTFGAPNLILITWGRSLSSDTQGYDIFRSSNPGGPFTRINNYTVDGTAAYEDRNLPPLTRFYYQIITRDLSHNASVPSVIASGTTNPPLAAGWPLELGQQSQSSVVLSNTSGDSGYELFTAADYQYAWHADGTEVRDGDGDDRTSGPYAPGGFDPVKAFAATTAVGDLDHDGDAEVVNVGWTAESLFVWNHLGQLVNGWPKWVMGDFNWSSPVLSDLDGDHTLEVIFWAAKGGRLFAWHPNGTEVANGDQNPATDGVLFQVSGTSYNYSSPAVAEIDGTLRPEIIFCVNLSTDGSGKVYALNHDGSPVPGWPFSTGIPGSESKITSSPAVGDLDNDGDHEIVVVADRDLGRMYVLNGNGTVRPGWPRAAPAISGQSRVASPVLGDLNEDGFLDIVYPGSDGRLYAYHRDGAQLPGFPVTYALGLSSATQSTPSLADIDGDQHLEILFGDETGKVHAYNHDGTLVNGFPIQTAGEVRATPVVWDIDADNLTEVAVVGWDSNVYIWDLPGEFTAARAPWPFFRHDVRNTGFVNQPPIEIGIADPGQSPGPAAARIYPARPNPFNPQTAIAFDVPGEGARPVSIAVYDLAGRLVRSLLEGPVGSGHHAVTWDGRGTSGRFLGTGVYFFRVTIGEQVFTEKAVLLK